MDAWGDGSALAEVRREYPGWRCWYAYPSGTYYAIQADHPRRAGYQVRAGTPAELREKIGTAGDAADLPVAPLGPSFGVADVAQPRSGG